MSRVPFKSAWGSDDPTKAAFAFLHADAFVQAGHEVQIFLLGEAVTLMRTCVSDAVVPVGWPPLKETFAGIIARASASTSEWPARGPVGSKRATWMARTPRSRRRLPS